MSDIAVTWAKAQRVGDRNSKDVLVYLASYADAYGYAWAAVDILAFEMDVSERMVQRGLAALRLTTDAVTKELKGFIEDTGKKHPYLGKLYPIYRLRVEHGPKNTLEARRLARDLGVTPASPQAMLRVTRASPLRVTTVSPK